MLKLTFLFKAIFLSFMSLGANAECWYQKPALYNYSGQKVYPASKFISLTTTKGTYECKEDFPKITCENGATFNLPNKYGMNNFDISIGGQLIRTTAYEVKCSNAEPRGIDYIPIRGFVNNLCKNVVLERYCKPDREENIEQWFTRNPINGSKVEIYRKLTYKIEKLEELNQ